MPDISQAQARQVWRNANLATMKPGGTPYGLIENGAIAAEGGRIVWAGASDDLPEDYSGWASENLDGRLVTPALIDCHTHLVYAGGRAREFEMRLQGASYEEISKAGGGIRSTVKATRAASEDELVEAALPRLDALIAEGAGTVEIKSGYGLDLESERRMLRAARRLGEMRPVRVCTTFLGAHALPEDYEGRAEAYIDLVCEEMMPALAGEGLVDAVDAFCERIGFTNDQTRRVFEKAKTLGLPVKLHAEQLSDQDGAALTAEFGGLSADHLEHLSETGIKAMAAAGTVAVLLPGAFYFLKDERLPPVDTLREAGVPMAVATDSNPGTSPMTSPLLAMNMACVLFGLTPEEALAGTTRNAAKALGLQGEAGVIAPGCRAELAVWNADHPAELSYRFGFNPLHARIMQTP